ncbi:hypothetical protein [uncultured Kordia sp.]|uniref:hypothetical protein n=1 Tax=uncultured Kordia sp. TaxID=507699 RepID=UPI002638EDF3|nr:hypothetical protein [uncultured Kordia sp.]
MKNYVLIIFTFIITESFSQAKIDITQIDFVRYEWSIYPKEKDTTLYSTLTKYKSGFYLEEFESKKDSIDKYGSFLIYKTQKHNLELRPRQLDEVHLSAFGNTIVTNYYDAYQNRDSMVALIQKSKLESKKIVIPFEKKYKRKGKLASMTDEDGINYYKYNIFGRLKRVEHFRDTTLYRIRTYRKNHLISETFPTRKKYKKKFTYEYDKKGRIIKSDNNDYHLYRYEYNEFGLSRQEKIYKKRNIVTEYTLFTYDENGRLISKKEYEREDRLIREFFYEYK